MKKIFLCTILVGVLTLSLCACGKSKPASSNDVNSATKPTEQTTSVELSKETKITKKMPDSEKITTAFDNTINADSFVLMMGMNGYGNVSDYNPLLSVRAVYEFYKSKNSYIGVEAQSLEDFLSLIDVDNDDEVNNFCEFWLGEVPEERFIEFKEQLPISEGSYGEPIDFKSYSLENDSGFSDGLYYNPNNSIFGVKLASSDLSKNDEFTELGLFNCFYNRDFDKVLDYSYEYEFGLPYRHFIRATGMIFDNYSKSKDDFYFVTNFNNEDGVYSFEAYLLDFYRYYAANSDYQLPQEANSGSNDVKIGVRYVLDGNYLTEISAYLLEDNDTKYDDYYSYIFKKINSIKEKDSLACAYFKEIDEKYEPGNYKKAAEVFFSEFENNNKKKFKLGEPDEHGIPTIIVYDGSSTSEYAYNGYKYVKGTNKDVGRNLLGYYTAKEVLDSIVNGTPLAEVPEWKQAYIDYLNDNEISNLSLVYIDEDDIPELVWSYGGCPSFITYNGGEIHREDFGRGGFYYFEKENKFKFSSDLGNFSDIVYELDNGSLKEIIRGVCEQKVDNDGNFVEDDQGSIVYEYYWNNELVSEEEYLSQLRKVFDSSSAKYISESDGSSSQQMIQTISEIVR